MSGLGTQNVNNLAGGYDAAGAANASSQVDPPSESQVDSYIFSTENMPERTNPGMTPMSSQNKVDDPYQDQLRANSSSTTVKERFRETSEKDILDESLQLPEAGPVQFIHQTVKDYLTKDGGSATRDWPSIDHMEWRMAPNLGLATVTEDQKEFFEIDQIEGFDPAHDNLETQFTPVPEYVSNFPNLPERNKDWERDHESSDGDEEAPNSRIINGSPTASVTSEASTMRLSNVSTAIEQVETASYEFYSMIRNHPILSEKFRRLSTTNGVDFEDFEDRLRKLLKRLAMDLKTQASLELHKSMSMLVSNRARAISQKLGEEYFTVHIQARRLKLEHLQPVQSTQEGRFLLERWLRDRFPNEIREGDSNVKSMEDTGSDEEDEELEIDEQLPSLGAVKGWLVGSDGFANFVASVSAWAKESQNVAISDAVKEQKVDSLQTEKGLDTLEIPNNNLPHTLPAPLLEEIAVLWENEVGSEIPWNNMESFAEASIHVRQSRSDKLSNRIKLAFESFTGQPWDWWPLSPPEVEIADGCVRLEWDDPDLDGSWVDVSPLLARKLLYLFGDLFRRNPTHRILEKVVTDLMDCLNYPRLVKKKFSISTSSSKNIEISSGSSGAGDPSSAVRKAAAGQQVSSTQQPANLSQSNQTLGNSGNLGTPSQLESPTSGSTGPGRFGSSLSSSPQGAVLQGFNILICVPRNEALQPGIISTPRCNDGQIVCDEAFFRQLYSQYRKLRGFWYYWFVPYKLHHCHAWKFNKDPPDVFSNCKEFPDSHVQRIYQVDPSPPMVPYREPMTPRQWRKRLYAHAPWYDSARTLCRALGKLVAIQARRVPCLHTAKQLKKMPKRINEFDLENETDEDHVWGLRAELRLSLLHVLAWQLVLLAAGFGLCSWWLQHHPGDLQGASVFFMTVLSVFVYFWTTLSSPFSRDDV